MSVWGRRWLRGGSNGLAGSGIDFDFNEVVYAEQVFESLLNGGKKSSFHLVFYKGRISGDNKKAIGYRLRLQAAEESVNLDGVDRVVAFHLGADKLPGFVEVAGVYHG